MEAHTFQAAADQVIEQTTEVLLGSTGQPALGAGGWSLNRIRALPMRIDDATISALEPVAQAPLPAPSPCDERHFRKCFAIVDAALPKRSHDEFGGELLVNTYRRMLGHLPAGAISHIATQAIATCRWFPTVAECLDMAKGWTAPPSDVRLLRDAARGAIGREKQNRFNEAMDALDAEEMDIEAFTALPDRWRGIAVETGRAWALRDGGYALCPADPARRRAKAAELIAGGLL